MYKKAEYKRTTLAVNQSYEGERIEQKIERIVNNKEPITDGAPIIFTERKNGVEPQYDIRTDRWEIAIDAMDKVSKTRQAQREQRIAEREGKVIEMKGENGGENTGKSAEPSQ